MSIIAQLQYNLRRKLIELEHAMLSVRITIDGDNLTTLPDLLLKELGDCYVYTANEVTLLFNEHYFLRTDSELMTVAVLNFATPGKCEVEIVSGGGRQGLAGFDWGTERSRDGAVSNRLQTICASQGWTFQPH
jgi:hypothetical protein